MLASQAVTDGSSSNPDLAPRFVQIAVSPVNSIRESLGCLGGSDSLFPPSLSQKALPAPRGTPGSFYKADK